jgi:hypothetical protein
MKTFAYFLALGCALTPVLNTTTARAANTLPNITEEGQERCFVRAYSKAHLAANPAQKIKGVAVALTKTGDFIMASIEIRSLDHKVMSNSGALLKNETSISKLVNASSVTAQMDADAGRFTLTQNRGDSVLLKVVGALYVGEEGCFDPDALAAGTATCSDLTIHEKTADSKMLLNLMTPNGSAMKSCSEMLDQQIYIND